MFLCLLASIEGEKEVVSGFQSKLEGGSVFFNQVGSLLEIESEAKTHDKLELWNCKLGLRDGLDTVTVTLEVVESVSYFGGR